MNFSLLCTKSPRNAMLPSIEKVSDSLSKRKNHVEPAAPTGGLTIEEERASKEKLGILKRSLNLERKAMKKNQEKILTHQEAFEKLRVGKLFLCGSASTASVDHFMCVQHSTGIENINEMVRLFVEKEDFNFALFNHIQRINKEATECDDEIEAVNEDVRKYQQEQGHNETTTVQIMHELELRRDKYVTFGFS
jgi:hypothetical protein